MSEVFGWGIEQFIFCGGCPDAAPLIADDDQCSRYIRDSLIETTISRDTRVTQGTFRERAIDSAGAEL